MKHFVGNDTHPFRGAADTIFNPIRGLEIDFKSSQSCKARLRWTVQLMLFSKEDAC
jgi:hypothetical protein